MVHEGALEYADTSLSCCGWGFDLAVASQRAMELAMPGGKRSKIDTNGEWEDDPMGCGSVNYLIWGYMLRGISMTDAAAVRRA